jgi:hypothetical protein
VPGQTSTLVDAGQSLPASGHALAEDPAAIQAGFDLRPGSATMFVGCDGSFAQKTENHAFRGGLNWRF